MLPSKALQDATSIAEIKQHEEDRRLYYVGMTRAKNELYVFRCRNVESSFTNEIIRCLPKDNTGKNIDDPIFKQTLINSTYTHSEKGQKKPGLPVADNPAYGDVLVHWFCPADFMHRFEGYVFLVCHCQ